MSLQTYPVWQKQNLTSLPTLYLQAIDFACQQFPMLGRQYWEACFYNSNVIVVTKCDLVSGVLLFVETLDFEPQIMIAACLGHDGHVFLPLRKFRATHKIRAMVHGESGLLHCQFQKHDWALIGKVYEYRS